MDWLTLGIFVAAALAIAGVVWVLRSGEKSSIDDVDDWPD